MSRPKDKWPCISPETRKKMVASRRVSGKAWHSEETRRKISTTLKGRRLTPKQATRKKRQMQSAYKKNPWAVPPPRPKGWKHSESTKEKIRVIRTGTKQSEETIMKRRPKISGANHWAWKGGITELRDRLSGSHEYKKWRLQVFLRDNRTCQDCGRTRGDGEIEDIAAHHIEHFNDIVAEFGIETIEDAFDCAALWELANGITLCRACHQKRHPAIKLHRRKETA